jgi:hypothetical protein
MNKKTEMDKKIFEDYLKAKRLVSEFYNDAIVKIQKVEASNEHEENIKNQFISQLVEFQFQLKIKYPLEYSDFVEKIEDKVRKLIFPYDGDEVDGLLVKYYNLKIVEDISDFYRYKADIYSGMRN